MTTKPPWLYTQSGVIPHRTHGDRTEILLITSLRRSRWIIPKGVVDFGLTPVESACKEAWEEAGIRGVARPEPIGTYHYEKWNGVCTVTVFLLRVETTDDAWPESIRRREWWPVEQAAELVEEPELRELIRAVPRVIAAPGGSVDA